MTSASNPLNDMQDPLAELRPLQLPTIIDSWPWAIGWYILIFILLTTIVLSIIFFVRYRRETLYKRQALLSLSNIKLQYERDQDITKSAEAMSNLLKQICLVHFPRQKISNLTGEAWLHVLDLMSNSTEFSQGSGSILGQRLFKNLKHDESAKKDIQVTFTTCDHLIRELSSKKIKELQYTFNINPKEA